MLPDEKIRGMLLTLELDKEAKGWDQLNSLYVVESVDDDPYLVLVAEFAEHPSDALDGLRLSKDVKGVVLISEAWTVTANPQMVELIRTRAEALGIPEELRELAVQSVIEQIHGRISLHPERVECRITQCILRDGSTFNLMRKRNEEVEFMHDDVGGRVINSLRCLIGVKEGRA
jgi:hypothetical protein